MKRATVIVALGLACGACASDDPTRWWIVDEQVELCAVAPYSETLESVMASQWRLDIEAGEYALPEAEPLREWNVVLIPDGVPIVSPVHVRDRDGTQPLGDLMPEVEVFENVTLSLLPADRLDTMWISAFVGSVYGHSGHWRLSVMIEAESGADFRMDDPRDVGFGCSGDVPRAPCFGRRFDVCDAGGPTTRTRVTLDRGEMVLDVRHVEGVPEDGDLHRVMFVSAVVRLDGVELVQDEFFRLLHSAAYSTVGDGSYGVLAPELEAAGLGCGIVVEHIEAEMPTASLVDCELQPIETLAIVAVERESLP